MCPDAESTIGSLAQEMGDQLPPHAGTPGRGCDCELGARAGYLVGGIEVGVADERAVEPGQDVPDPGITAVAQVQHHMFRQRPDPVVLRDAFDEKADIADVGLVEAREDLPLHRGSGRSDDRVGHGQHPRGSWPLRGPRSGDG